MNGFLGVIYLLGAFTLAGTSVIAAQFVAGVLGPFTITAASLFIAWLCMFPLCGRGFAKDFLAISIREKMSLVFQALFGIFLFRWLLLLGLTRTSAGEAGILTGATPAITAILAWLFLKEPMTPLRFVGIFSTVVGVLSLQGVFLTGVGLSDSHWAGNLLVLLAATCESLFNIHSRTSSIKAADHEGIHLSPIHRTFGVITIAMALSAIPALTESPFNALCSLNIEGWASLLWYGVIVTALAFIFWYEGIRRCEASVAAAFSGMMPFTALILSVMILGEEPGFQRWLGGFFVGVGMIMTGLKSKEPFRDDKAITG